MPRLFTGIELPEEIQDLLGDLQVPLPGARWVEMDDLHLTLRFVGDIDVRQADEFLHELSAIDENVFPIRISGLGVFGGYQPKTLWAGIEAGPELEALARATDRAARNAGLPPQKHSFKAHVTLARLKNTRPDDVARFLTQYGALASEPFMVERFALFSSKPKVGGGPYVVEDVFPLRGSTSDIAYHEWA